jgi:hypothetical protein
MAQKTKRFVVTEKGQKTGILLSLKEYRTLIEDLRDLAIMYWYVLVVFFSLITHNLSNVKRQTYNL